MENSAYLIGTSHVYQTGGRGCTCEQSGKFVALLKQVCKKHGIKAIAEEMNREGLEKYASDNSLGYLVARELELTHLYGDPNYKEREEAGIRDRGKILCIAQLNELTEEETDKLIEKEELKRENIWLQRVIELEAFPLLFVCGANHAIRFSKTLAHNGITVEVLYKDWGGDS